jgi:hypothetical protein
MKNMDVGTLVAVGLGLAAVPIAFVEYVVSRARREATRKIEPA